MTDQQPAPPPADDEEPTVVQPGSSLPLPEDTHEGRPGSAEGPSASGPGERTARIVAGEPVTPGEQTVRLSAAELDLDGPTRALTPGPAEEPTEDLVRAGDAPTLDDRDVAAEAEPAGDGPASPERVTLGTGAPGVPEKTDAPDSPTTPEPGAKPAPWRRLSSAGALIWVLLALLGFTLVVQLRSNDGDQGLANTRQEDLVRILSDLEARDSRLQSEINALETSQRQLTSGVAGRQAALDDYEKRADELGLLAGTLPGRGPGLSIRMDKVKSSAVLNAVQELRGAGGEVMQIAGSSGGPVRIVASSYFVDVEGGAIVVDGTRLSGPFTVLVIGVPQTMQTALQIPGGVVASVSGNGGSVLIEQRTTVEVTAVRKATTLQYARPAS